MNVLFIPSLSYNKSKNSFNRSSTLSRKLEEKYTNKNPNITYTCKDLNSCSMSTLNSLEDSRKYVEYVLKEVVDFLKTEGEKRIIVSSFSGGVLDFLIQKSKIDPDKFENTKILYFKPFFFSRVHHLENIAELQGKFSQNVKDHFLSNPPHFNSLIYYIFGDLDTISGTFEEVFLDISPSKPNVKILTNSLHFSTNDEFPQFEDFFYDFMS